MFCFGKIPGAGRLCDDAAMTGTAPPQMTAPPVTVLLAEDEPLVALHAEQILEDGGYSVVASLGDARAAVAAAERLRPDLCVLDITLAGGTDGLAAAVDIQGRLGIPVVLASALANPALAVRHGIRAWVTKPYSGADLLAAVAQVRPRPPAAAAQSLSGTLP